MNFELYLYTVATMFMLYYLSDEFDDDTDTVVNKKQII